MFLQEEQENNLHVTKQWAVVLRKPITRSIYQEGRVMKDNICECQTTSDNNSLTQLTINVPSALLKQLQEAATLAKTDVQDLILCYAQQGLLNSSPQLKRQHFLTHAKGVLEKYGIHDKTIEEIVDKFPY